MAWGSPTSARSAGKASRSALDARPRSTRVGGVADALADEAVAEVAAQGVARDGDQGRTGARICAMPAPTRRSKSLSPTTAAMRRAFESAHKARFGFIDRAKPIVIEAVIGRGDRRRGAASSSARAAVAERRAPAAARDDAFFSKGAWRDGDVYLREDLPLGARDRRPGAHHRAAPDHRGRARLARRDHAEEPRAADAASSRCRSARRSAPKADPVMLEIFNNLFMSIAEQMGVTLQNTAYSVNIKERLDFSCAVFDADGRARRQRAAYAGASGLDGPLGRDDHPRQSRAASGPATCSRSTRPITAARICPTSPSARRCSTTGAKRSCSGPPRAAITPTSAASRRARCRPLATTIHEEGVYIDNFLLVERGRFRERELYRAAWPAGPIRRAIRCRTSTTSRRRSPPTRRACASSARMVEHVRRSRRSRPIWATCRTTPTRACAA